MRAIVSQLITSREAHSIEWRLLHATTERVDRLVAPPLPHHFAGFAPAQLQRFGLPARKATALVRICRTFDPERLRRLPADAAAARLESERGVGPYSVGFVWTQGLGRYDRGIVGDLGLLKICSAIEGRWVEPEDTARILGRYGEWAGLACVYLMAGAARGMVPLKLSPPEVRRERIKARRAA
jgi:3-methyladenine DNA glycosylase/8-oxoguanine DNA glycosylase